MEIHIMNLSTIPFEKIVDHKKTIESRLYDKKRQQIHIGDEIEFICNSNPQKKITTRVKALHRYDSFEELFSAFAPEVFGGKSKEELLKEVNMFYSKAEQQEYGVIGIEIELL